MSGGFGLGGNYSQYDSQSYSGLYPTYKGPTSRRAFDSDYELDALTRKAAGSSFGKFMGKHVKELVPTNEYGLPVATNQFMDHALRTLYGRASAGGATRGHLSPESTEGIIGSALTNLGREAIPYVIDFNKYLTGLPDELYQRRLGYYQALQGSRANLLGSKSDASGFGVGANVQMQGGASPTGTTV